MDTTTTMAASPARMALPTRCAQHNKLNCAPQIAKQTEIQLTVGERNSLLKRIACLSFRPKRERVFHSIDGELFEVIFSGADEILPVRESHYALLELPSKVFHESRRRIL